MKAAQDALINHLTAQFPAYEPAAYAGQLNKSYKGRLGGLPRILVMFDVGEIWSENSNSDYRFNVLVISESRLLDAEAAQDANLSAADAVVAYLKDETAFTHGLPVKFYTITALSAGLLVQDPRYTVINISTTLRST